MIYLQLYLSFLQVGLFSVGGGYAAMPLIRSQVVELHPWMTLQEFTNLITIAEMTPGPIAVNCATFVGLRIAQLPGAVIATLGCITPALVLVSLLALCATLIPIKVLGRNLREVLKIAPKGDVSRLVASEVEALRLRHGVECYSHLAKSGRRFDLELNILVAPGQEWPVERQDALRQELWSRLGDTLGDAWLSVCFTREKRWL